MVKVSKCMLFHNELETDRLVKKVLGNHLRICVKAMLIYDDRFQGPHFSIPQISEVEHKAKKEYTLESQGWGQLLAIVHGRGITYITCEVAAEREQARMQRVEEDVSCPVISHIAPLSMLTIFFSYSNVKVNLWFMVEQTE